MGTKYYLFLIAVWTSAGAHPALFTVGNGPLSWEHSSQGMELFTNPYLVLILTFSVRHLNSVFGARVRSLPPTAF